MTRWGAGLIVITGLAAGGLVAPPSAEAQMGPSLLRNQARTVQRAIEMQVRQAVRPRLVIRSGPIETVTAARVAASGRWLATTLSDGSLRLWDMARGGEAFATTLPFTARAAATDPDGALVAAIAVDGRAVVTAPSAEGTAAALAGVSGAQAVAAVRGTALFGLADGRLLPVVADGTAGAALALGAAVGALEAVGPDAAVAGLADGAVVLVERQAGVWRETARWTAGAPVRALAAGGDGLIALAGDSVLGLSPGGAIAWQRPAAGARGVAVVPATAVALLSETGVSLLALDDGRDLGRLEAPVEAPTALAAPGPGRLLVAGAQGRAAVVAVPSGSPLVNLYSTRTGWAVLDPAGRFDGTDRSVRDVAWDVDGRVLDIDRFARRYFEPGLAAKALAASDAALLTDPGPPLDDGVLPPPEVTLEAPASAAPGQAVALTVTATVSGAPAEGEDPDLWLFRNGKRLPATFVGPREDARQGQRTVWTWRAAVPAEPGAMDLEAVVLAWNDIQVSSGVQSVAVSAPPAPPGLMISGVGIDAYAGPTLALNYAVADAKAVTDALLDTQAGGLPDDARVAVLTLDQEATRESILTRLDALRNSQPSDILMVFLSGHARAIGADWYFLPSEALSLAHDEHVRQVGVSAEDLAAALTAAPAERVVLIIDACQSGAAVGAFETFGQRRALNGVAQSTGVTVMAATRADQLAPEYSDLGHGIFSYTLLNGLQRNADGTYNADRWPADGHVMVGELRRYVETYVPLLARQLDQQHQSTGRGATLADRVPVTPTSTPVAADFAVR